MILLYHRNKKYRVNPKHTRRHGPLVRYWPLPSKPQRVQYTSDSTCLSCQIILHSSWVTLLEYLLYLSKLYISHLVVYIFFLSTLSCYEIFLYETHLSIEYLSMLILQGLTWNTSTHPIGALNLLPYKASKGPYQY